MATATAKNANKNNTLAIIKKDVVDVVSNKVQEFVSKGSFNLPPNYSVEKRNEKRMVNPSEHL